MMQLNPVIDQTCPRCRNVVPGRARFCGRCGYAFAAATPQAAPVVRRGARLVVLGALLGSALLAMVGLFLFAGHTVMRPAPLVMPVEPAVVTPAPIERISAGYRGRDLRNHNFAGALLVDCDFRGCQLQGANFTGALLTHANFTGANLDGADFAWANLSEAIFQAKPPADPPASHLGTATLAGATLSQVDLHGFDLRGANLRQAVLTSTNLAGAQLTGADLREAHLDASNLRFAALQSANLRGAHVMSCDLLGARLDGAILLGADLESAYALTPQQLRAATTNESTRLPWAMRER